MFLNKTLKKRIIQNIRDFKRQYGNSQEQKTQLYDIHLKYDGKMVNFAGFSMPIQYGNTSITNSHIHTRNNVSIFDVSHMLQTEIKGKYKDEFLESICVADIQGLESGKGTLSLFTNENGGILDDLIATKTEENSLFIVSNASRRDKDKNIMQQAQAKFKSKGKDISLRFFDPEERSLIAIQGPKTSQILSKIINIDLNNFYFMQSKLCSILGVENCRISRAGYTGEDGVEISIPGKKSIEIVETLLKNDNVKLAGLGARDSLRLEAGLCLYGNDMDETITPVEAGLTWTIGKRRKETQDFPGATIIINQIKSGVQRKRTGFINQGIPIRQGYKIYNQESNKIIGEITSGCPSPSLKQNISMGYIETKYSKFNTDLNVKVRDKFVNVKVIKMPFIKSNYYVPKKTLRINKDQLLPIKI